MREIKKVGLIGAGAVGSYVVWGLAGKAGLDFAVIARGERKERLERDGLSINDKMYFPKVETPEEAKGLDLLLVALKATAVEGALEDIAAAVGEDTIVVSLLNGIDSEEIIGERIGMEHMLYSLIRISSTRDGNTISFSMPNPNMGIFVGEAGKGDVDGRAAAVKAVFDGTSAYCHVREDILSDMWNKFAMNISRNLPQAVLGIGAGCYDDSRFVADISAKLRAEVVKVAAAKGITVPETEPYVDPRPWQRYSTLQDLDAGRPTEIESFSGALLKIAKKLGISCPYNEIVYDFVKALEEKNAGVFDYGREGF